MKYRQLLLLVSFLGAPCLAQKPRPVVILGSGPAGLTAAQYCARAGLDTTVISGPLPGGLLTQTSFIENYSGVPQVPGAALVETMRTQAEQLQVQFIEDSVDRVDLSSWPFTLHLDGGDTLTSYTIIVATGATPRKLGIPGESLYWGWGVSSCAICDAPFFKGKQVYVVGGGDSAVEAAIQLSSYVDKVTILVRKDRMRAAHAMQQKLKGYPAIQAVQYNKVVTKVYGSYDQPDGTGPKEVTALELYDASTDTTETVSADGLFLAIGHIPNVEVFGEQLKVTDSGHILVKDSTQHTSVPGVFAAGDVVDNRYRQAQKAAGDGCAAALDAFAWLHNQDDYDLPPAA